MTSVWNTEAFPEVSREAWRRRVREELGGKEPETLATQLPGGLEVQPLYDGDGTVVERILPGRSKAGPRPWRLAVEVSGEPAEAAARVERDLARGADLLWLPADLLDDLDQVLAPVDSETTALVFDSEDRVAVAADRWAVWVAGKDLDPSRLEGGLGGDPFGTWARRGKLGRPMDEVWQELGEVAARCAEEAPGMRAALVSTVAYHGAGAAITDELALGVASGLETLRQLMASGLSVDQAAEQILFSMAVDSDLFVEIAKLRAAQRLWAKVVAACGGGAEARRMRIHATTSEASWTARAPWLNLLRGGVQGFGAAVAGVWSLRIDPYDRALGVASDAARRHAISTHHLLAEEAHLGRVADPAAGSGALEGLTDQIARRSWERVQQIEEMGGMAEVLEHGEVHIWIENAAEERDVALARRRTVIVGVNEFADLDEERPEREPSSEVVEEDPKAFRAWRRSRPYEALHSAAEAWEKEHGRRPRIAQVSLGPLAEHGPRADFVRRFFACGGVEVVLLEKVEDFVNDDCEGVVFCGKDERYGQGVPELAAALREAGAERLFLAGRPDAETTEALREAGVKVFVHLGCDAFGILENLLSDLGVQP